MTDQPETNGLNPGLYIVATPIGNLGDITIRAADTLRRCDAIACEDTRVTAKLLSHLEIRKPLIRYDDHASDVQKQQLIEKARSSAIALVTDAGTPLVSDPGFKLARDAQREGIFITSLPGPSAVITAITLSGLPTDRFLFAGFLPQKDKARRDALLEFAHVNSTLVFFDTGPRLAKTLAAIDELFPLREVSVCRELTKLFEEARRGVASELLEHYSQSEARGEIVILIGPPAEEAGEVDSDSLLKSFLEHEKPSRAAAEVAKMTGLDRKALYERAMELKKSAQAGS